MNQYRVVMRNPKNGQMESYISEPMTLREITASLEIFRMGGYTDIDLSALNHGEGGAGNGE